VVIEGNRDFFLDAPELAAELDWTGLEYEFQQGGRRFRLVHGDRVNLRDFQYRFWSWVSKSWPARLWARLLPRRVAVAIVRTMEARLAETNKRFRYHKPLPSLRRAAEKMWASGVDVVLWGHFHTSWVYRHDDRSAMILPAWLDSRCSALIDAEGRLELVDPGLTASRPLHRMS
jgi:UDP-2,3-diacylglucosamine pyrophosphatase LpxH